MKDFSGVLSIDHPDKPYVVYFMYSEDITDKHIYIGVTANYLRRPHEHSRNRTKELYKNHELYQWMTDVIEKQNKKVIFKVIEKECSEEYAFPREIELVKEYREKGYIVLNKTNGGKGNSGNIPWNKGIKMPDYLIKKFSDSHMGQRKGPRKPHTESTKNLIRLKNEERKLAGWVSPKRKKVYKYISGILDSVYSCLEEASKKEKVSVTTIADWCKKQRIPKNTSITWSYLPINTENLQFNLN